MKRYPVLFLLTLLLSTTACNDTNEPKPPVDSEIPTTATNSWIMNTMQLASSYKALAPSNKVTLSMAKGEWEHFQLILETPKKGKLTFLREKANDQIEMQCRELVDYLGTEDVLVPRPNGITTTNKVVKLWISYRTNASTPKGTTQEILKISGTAGDFIIGVTLHVYDCTIPVKPSTPALFGINQERLSISPLTGEELMAKRKEWADLLLEYRTVPYFAAWIEGMKVENSSSPYPMTDSRSIEYLKNEKFARIVLPCHTLSDTELRSVTSKIKNNSLEEKSIYYVWDEPTKMAEYNKIRTIADRVHTFAPQAKIITTFYRGPEDGDRVGDLFALWDILDGATNIFCTGVWSLQGSESRSMQCKAKCKAGQEWWNYVCMGDKPGLAYSSSAIENRAILWRNYKEEPSGFLYWAVNAFASMSPLKPRSELPAGDGILIYPGEPFGANIPCVSIRLERWRDSAEDYELMTLMEKEKGRPQVLKLLNNVYKNAQSISTNPTYVENFRKKLLEESSH